MPDDYAKSVQSFTVLGICRADLERYVTSAEADVLTDEEMVYIADKVAENIHYTDVYWQAVEAVVDDIQELLADKQSGA